MVTSMDGQTNGWTMFLSYEDAIDASESYVFMTDFAILTQAIRLDGLTDRPMDQRSD